MTKKVESEDDVPSYLQNWLQVHADQEYVLQIDGSRLQIDNKVSSNIFHSLINHIVLPVRVGEVARCCGRDPYHLSRLRGLCSFGIVVPCCTVSACRLTTQWVVGSNPACFLILALLVRKATANPLIKFAFLEKLGYLFLVSANLEIGYAAQPHFNVFVFRQCLMSEGLLYRNDKNIDINIMKIHMKYPANSRFVGNLCLLCLPFFPFCQVNICLS